MADSSEEKLAALQQENERLKAELAAKPKADGKSGASEEEDLTPTPSQEELNHVKLGLHHKGTYKTRQAKAG